jgi:adenylate cyclase
MGFLQEKRVRFSTKTGILTDSQGILILNMLRLALEDAWNLSEVGIMKRIIYISTVNRHLADEEIESIGQVSARNNRSVGITGVLISVHDYFFQVLEGEEDAIAQVIERIRRDPRHRDMHILKAETEISERLFPKWSMRTIRLAGSGDMILQAIRDMLQNIAQSHRIIERYTQPSVLKFLTEGINPLTVPPRKTEKIVLFCDMVGFSYLSDLFPVEQVADVVNAFLEVCSTAIAEHGGVVAKYVGDCAIAYFEHGQADEAITACLDVLRRVRDMRHKTGCCHLMKFLYCGFGVAAGTVIEGNFGSSVKMDYTVLGGTVNMAARLEALTREIAKPLALSESVMQGASRGWPFVHVGDFQLKGSGWPCPVYSLDDPLLDEFKCHGDLVAEMRLACAGSGIVQIDGL